MTIDPAADTIAQLSNMVALIGSDGTYTIAKTSATQVIRGLIAKMDNRDTALVQAYGVNGSRLTFQANIFTQRPAKFDTWTVNGVRYVFGGVSDIVIAGQLVGYTVYCKGDFG
jgi:hypothetical protein